MILEPREKIIKLRKELKMSQKELAADVYSQSYIAAIEKGKRKIQEEALYYFVTKFNEEYLKRGIGKTISYEWLSKPFQKQLREFYEDKCEKILKCREKDKLYSYYNEIVKIEEELKLEERVRIYHYLGYMFIMVEDHEKSEEVYKKALYEAILLEDYDYLGKILANLYHNLEVMKKVEGIKEYQCLLEKYEGYFEDRIIDTIYTKLLFLYEYKKDLKEAIQCIEKLIEVCSEERIADLNLGKFTYYLELGDIKSAKTYYEDFKENLNKVPKYTKYFYQLEVLSYLESIKEFDEIERILSEVMKAEKSGKLLMETSLSIGRELTRFGRINEGKEVLIRILINPIKLETKELPIQVSGLKILIPIMEREEVHLVIDLWNKSKKLLQGYRDYSYIPPFIGYFNQYYYSNELSKLKNDLEIIFDTIQ